MTNTMHKFLKANEDQRRFEFAYLGGGWYINYDHDFKPDELRDMLNRYKEADLKMVADVYDSTIAQLEENGTITKNEVEDGQDS